MIVTLLCDDQTVKKLWEASKCSSFRSLDNSDLIACTVKTEDK